MSLGRSYVLFSMWADSAAFNTTLVGMSNRNYTSPASKWTDALREALPPELRPVLEWELPLKDTEEPARL